jgi:deoxyinosine 3'endonuclease (endonuclease V)
VATEEVGTISHMSLMRGAAAVGIARKIYTEARKPENQRRIKAAVEQLRQRQAARRGGAGHSSTRGRRSR